MRVDPALTRTIDHPDPTVQEVLDIWAARFLHSGIPLGDLTGTVKRIQTWSDWGPEWADKRQWKRDRDDHRNGQPGRGKGRGH